MPIRNEAPHLAAALATVRQQDYPGNVRVIMAIGPSSDDTAQVASALAVKDSELLIVDNPTGKTPAALNLAIRAGVAPVIVRVDGHSQLSDGYIQRAVETMRRTGAANVGGMQVPVGTTPFENAVAAATTSWLGTGGASYRTGGIEEPVDTVYLGVFDREAVEAVGLFDERLIRNQDYELNIRLRAAGGTVLFDPELSVGYTPRGSWKALAKQYYEYGQWKAVVMRMHPDSVKVRQIIPAAAAPLGAFVIVGAARWRALLVFPAAYLCIAAVSTQPLSGIQRLRRAAALVCTHASWGLGFWVRQLRIAR
jgi:glycosyltransferase involved in cell wall biosynthesis